MPTVEKLTVLKPVKYKCIFSGVNRVIEYTKLCNVFGGELGILAFVSLHNFPRTQETQKSSIPVFLSYCRRKSVGVLVKVILL